MKKKALLLQMTVLLFVSASLFSFDWPLAESTILSTFGGKGDQNFSVSVLIGTGRQRVRPILDGEIIFYHEGTEDRWGVQSGLGLFTVVEHPGGLRSVYGHLDSLADQSDSYRISKVESLGGTGESGFSMMRNVSLAIIDVENGQYINPLILLPPFEDLSSPLIQAVYIKEDDILRPVSETNNILPGEIDLFMKAYDPGENVKFFNPMNVFEIIVFVNGVEKSHITFEGILESDERLVLASRGNPGSKDLFAGSFLFNLGSFTMSPGESRIEILVSDYLGNETGKLIRFFVQE